MAIKKNYPEKYGWWISELNSLGINTEAKDEELTDIKALEDLTDNIKQNFIHEYKNRSIMTTSCSCVEKVSLVNIIRSLPSWRRMKSHSIRY